jgi:hypothetical protein
MSRKAVQSWGLDMLRSMNSGSAGRANSGSGAGMTINVYATVLGGQGVDDVAQNLAPAISKAMARGVR